MLTLIWIVVLSLAFAYFSTQNTQSVDIVLGNYLLAAVPVYILVGVTLLLGLLLAAIISFLNSISTAWQLHGKDQTIHHGQKSLAALQRQVQQLEVENARLKGELDEVKTERR